MHSTILYRFWFNSLSFLHNLPFQTIVCYARGVIRNVKLLVCDFSFFVCFSHISLKTYSMQINKIEVKEFSQRENDKYHDRDLSDVVIIDDDDISILS